MSGDDAVSAEIKKHLLAFAGTLQPGQEFRTAQAIGWVIERWEDFKGRAPRAGFGSRVLQCLHEMTENNVRSGGAGPFRNVAAAKYRLSGGRGGGAPAKETAEGFTRESDLRDFLAENLDVLGLGLTLHPGGVEFPAGGGFIDILARDKRGGFVVIELKTSQGHERAIGQITRYIAWVKENLARHKPVRGVILTRSASEGMRLAASMVPSVHLLEYSLSITARPAGDGGERRGLKLRGGGTT